VARSPRQARLSAGRTGAPARGKPQPTPQVNASLAIDVGEMTWRREVIRDVSLALEMVKNVVSVASPQGGTCRAT